MYKKTKKENKVKTINGTSVSPLATLVNEHDRRLQIAIDDGHYVLLINRPNGLLYAPTAYIPPEVIDIISQIRSKTTKKND